MGDEARYSCKTRHRDGCKCVRGIFFEAKNRGWHVQTTSTSRQKGCGRTVRKKDDEVVRRGRGKEREEKSGTGGCKTLDGCPFGKDKTTRPVGDRVGTYSQTPSSHLGAFVRAWVTLRKRERKANVKDKYKRRMRTMKKESGRSEKN